MTSVSWRWCLKHASVRFVIFPAIHGSLSNASGMDDGDNGYTVLNLMDVVNTTGYIQQVSINFYQAPVPNVAALWFYILAPMFRNDSLQSFVVVKQYLVPNNQLLNETGVQTIIVPITTNMIIQDKQYLGVGFGQSSGSPYRVAGGRNRYRISGANITGTFAGYFSQTSSAGMASTFILISNVSSTNQEEGFRGMDITIKKSIIMPIFFKALNTTYGTLNNTGVDDNDFGYLIFNALDVVNASGFLVQVSINFSVSPSPSQAWITINVIGATRINTTYYIPSYYTVPLSDILNQTGVQTFNIVPSLYIQQGQYVGVWFANNLSGSAYRTYGRKEYYAALTNLSYYVENDYVWTCAYKPTYGFAVQFQVNNY
ncbi:unnamed protein product [Didymodactylos carnosus]|uniref:Uncharacterized protein n=1 Tax=Didymodactylos carnosus TaxID=1234261 RepID=A0A815SX14_9BILA|nr:unnamed protein product [Didymodactylos carnosus]CAF1499495.1 unnamed protein product [Didymodactylos carnosus]CAF4096725.1 unnamed protein product [Didymodactylos carnosus]CAF4361389.1 unnamed protein product [Didymodactylos carnosus]